MQVNRAPKQAKNAPALGTYKFSFPYGKGKKNHHSTHLVLEYTQSKACSGSGNLGGIAICLMESLAGGGNGDQIKNRGPWSIAIR